MKNLLIILIALIFSFNAPAQNLTLNRKARIVTIEYVNANLNASNVIFACQCIINPIMQEKGLKAIKTTEVATILGVEMFAKFKKAVLLLNSKRLIFKNVIGANEVVTTDIMKLKYGKRFKNLATYVTFKYNEARVIEYVVTGKKVKVFGGKELISYTERIAKGYINNVTYNK